MKNILCILLFSCFSLTIISCGSGNNLSSSTYNTSTHVDQTTQKQAVIDCYLVNNSINDNSTIDNSSVSDSSVSNSIITNCSIIDNSSVSDSSLSAGIEIDTNIAISSFQTNYPGALILGAEYSLDKIKLASNLKFGFSNELGSSTTPRFSLGTEYRPVQWISLLGGISVGGYEGFQWGSGISMRLLFLQFSCAYSEYGGMLDSAKGFSLSLSNSIVF